MIIHQRSFIINKLRNEIQFNENCHLITGQYLCDIAYSAVEGGKVARSTKSWAFSVIFKLYKISVRDKAWQLIISGAYQILYRKVY